jgi:hypothetical protein
MNAFSFDLKIGCDSHVTLCMLGALYLILSRLFLFSTTDHLQKRKPHLRWWQPPLWLHQARNAPSTMTANKACPPLHRRPQRGRRLATMALTATVMVMTTRMRMVTPQWWQQWRRWWVRAETGTRVQGWWIVPEFRDDELSPWTLRTRNCSSYVLALMMVTPPPSSDDTAASEFSNKEDW